MTFKDEPLADAIEICSPDHLGEQVTYYPSGNVEEEGLARNAIVERQPVEPSDVEPGQGVVLYELMIPDDSTDGVAASSVVVGLDLVDLADEVGTIRRCTVIRCQDEQGMLRMTLRVGPEVEEEP